MKKNSEEITIIEKNIYRTNIRRLIDTLYLCVPIALAFVGCFLASPIWSFFKKEQETPQFFRFICAVTLFSISVIFVFIKTRKINPIMKIGIFSSNSTTEQKKD